MSLSLGAAVVLSLASVCCGLGFVTAPWFMCELLVLQLSFARGVPLSGRAGRLPAMAVMLGAVMLVTTVGFLALLGTSVGAVEPRDLGPPTVVELADLLHTGGSYAILCSLGTLMLVLPYLYAPLLLLERRGGLIGSLLESARMVFAAGAVSRLWLSALAHGLQVLPVLLAALFGWLSGHTDQVPQWILLGLPLLCLTLPLGQGMIVASYIETVTNVRGLASVPVGFQLPRALGVIWSLLLASPMVVSALVSLSLLRPVELVPGSLSGVVAFDVAVRDDPQTLRPPATALALSLDARAVSVAASDGGGAGTLPLPATDPIERVRVLRAADAYGIEVHQAGSVTHTWIDRAGVRLDDGLKLRLLARFPRPVLWALLLGLLVTGFVAAPVLTSLGRVRRAHQLGVRSDHAADALATIRQRVFLRAWLGAALVSPFALFALYWSLRANW